MEFQKIVNKIYDNINDNINVSTMGVIEEYDRSKGIANIQPLNTIAGKRAPLLINVPVMFMKWGSFNIYPEYRRGDVVFVLFLNEDNDNVIMTGNLSEPTSARKHSKDDAIVIGPITPLNKRVEENKAGLFISNENAKISLFADGTLDLNLKNLRVLADSISVAERPEPKPEEERRE